jgi:hypothetical protein
VRRNYLTATLQAIAPLSHPDKKDPLKALRNALDYAKRKGILPPAPKPQKVWGWAALRWPAVGDSPKCPVQVVWGKPATIPFPPRDRILADRLRNDWPADPNASRERGIAAEVHVAALKAEVDKLRARLRKRSETNQRNARRPRPKV